MKLHPRLLRRADKLKNILTQKIEPGPVLAVRQPTFMHAIINRANRNLPTLDIRKECGTGGNTHRSRRRDFNLFRALEKRIELTRKLGNHSRKLLKRRLNSLFYIFVHFFLYLFIDVVKAFYLFYSILFFILKKKTKKTKKK